MPGRFKLTNSLIKEKADQIRKRITTNMHTANYICFTIDLWSNRQMKAFLGINGHYINNWEMHSAMIACNRFIGRHTGENIRNEFDKVVSTYNLENKIACVISDNASNMVKTFKVDIPGFKNSLDGDTESDTECDETDDKVGNDDENLETVDVEHESFFPKHLRCYARSQQLVVRDAFKNCGRELKKALTKAASIVNHVRRSITATELLEGEKRLQTATVTRWNSQLMMVRSVLSVDAKKLEEVNAPVKLTSFERKLLNELCEVLKPFEFATTIVQKEKSVSASLAIPTTLQLKHNLKELKNTAKLEHQTVKFIDILEESIDSRLIRYEQEDEYVLATMLDPRFKLDWCTQNFSKHEDLLVSKLRQTSVTECEETSPPRMVSKGDFFSFMDNVRSPARKRHQSGKTTCEVERYLSEPYIHRNDDSLKYWSSHSKVSPGLAEFASKYLTIPCTSAPVERLFSIAGKIFRPDRCRMNDETFHNLIMIKCNSEAKNA
ncbi:zinc finger BED domain-containing protein 4-like [Mercenaria mercenaria]|uniref:zinc finger BED domain-containing protein 4-like n=1 Tax=Mercenaria mercenaria TaxID=6596 RepID=UPI00234E5445|nr:zinc finger BED domain-containing protein 4-like [Mercenaria mercenaria]